LLYCLYKYLVASNGWLWNGVAHSSLLHGAVSYIIRSLSVIARNTGFHVGFPCSLDNCNKNKQLLSKYYLHFVYYKWQRILVSMFFHGFHVFHGLLLLCTSQRLLIYTTFSYIVLTCVSIKWYNTCSPVPKLIAFLHFSNYIQD